MGPKSHLGNDKAVKAGRRATAVRRLLLRWFDRSGRNFYWRANREPYIVLLSEILLKKTTAPVVEKFLPVFLRKFPDFGAISRARVGTLQRVLQPLGLSDQRAHQIRDLSLAITGSTDGCIPTTREGLLSLPGVGDYTANSVLCVSFGHAVPVVDTNVARIVMRVFGVGHSRYEPRRSPEIWKLAADIAGRVPAKAVSVNWALLDLGATICTARNPRCTHCPLSSACLSSSTRSRIGRGG
jgi:A/G-specific adenine glycosylase